MRYWTIRVSMMAFAAALPCVGQTWEVGGAAGYSTYRDVTVTGAASGTAGFNSGYAVGALLGNSLYRSLGGEIRYTYLTGDLKVSSGNVSARASGHSQAAHYDLLLHGGSKESAIRPFLAAGAGVKVFSGTGREAAYQPLGNLLVLTHATQAEPLISVGGGVKFSLGRRALLRLDVRDYLTPRPDQLLAAPPNTRVTGWMNDLVFMAGVSAVF
jgi:hypothetical protein